MTIDQIFAPSSNGQAYSIQDVLAAVGNQYQPQAARGNQSIDDVLRGLTSGYNPVQTPMMPYGVAQYGAIPSESAMYMPSAFDKEALTAKYDAAKNAYQEALAAGKSEAEARQKEAEMKSKYAIAGSLAGSYFGLPPMVGSLIGQAVAEPVDDVFNSIADVFGW